jgi:hypothetical protein
MNDQTVLGYVIAFLAGMVVMAIIALSLGRNRGGWMS